MSRNISSCKMAALSRHMRARKGRYLRQMREYEGEVLRARKLVKKQREMEEAKVQFALGEYADGEKPPSPVKAGQGVTDLSAQVGGFADMIEASVGRPPPTLKILLEEGEIRPLIAEALLATADRINDGLPVDAHKSVAPVQRKRAMQLMG